MFRAMDKRIKIILILVVLIYIGLASFIVFGTIKDRTMAMQRQLYVQNIEQQNKNAQLYLKWLEETTRLALNHPGLQDALASERYDETIAPVLDGLRSSNLDISAIIIYGVRGTIYSTSNISGIKSYETIMNDPQLAEFMASDDTSQWMIQSPYKLVSFPYDPRTMLFYMEKIVDEQGRLRGVLFLESGLSKLYSFYRSGDQSISESTQVFFLEQSGNNLIAADGVSDSLKADIQALAGRQRPGDPMAMNETKDDIVLLYRLYKSSDRIVIVINTDKLGEQLNWLKDALLIVNLATAGLFIFLIVQLSRSISNPLKQLYRKMRTTMKEP